MKDTILAIINDALGAAATDAVPELSVPDEPSFGHYSTNVAMRLAKMQKRKPMELAAELAAKIKAKAPAGSFARVEAVAPGFINFWLSDDAVRAEFAHVVSNGAYGKNTELAGKTVMVEFTDPNPFKLFHIGHLMSNTIGESFSRLYEAAGAKVLRANYQGDVGLHVAKAVWGMEHNKEKMPDAHADLAEKMAFLGDAYAAGSRAYDDEGDLEARGAIDVLNEKIYSRSDETVNTLYDAGRKWSLEYFETVYARLGTKFDKYFFERDMVKEGLATVLAHEDIFVKSEGAIVFPGEKYGLHTRVFVNSRGLPTYEAKELGLNKKKFEENPLGLSVIVTANEIIDYFRVLIKAMELALPPEVAARTRHMPHGMLRLPTGKMSSRTGDVITGESLLDKAKLALREKVSERSSLDDAEREEVTEAIAVGAIKYSILKQNPGQDIIFDFEKSLSFEGDSGPYLQYAYARLRSIIRKAGDEGFVPQSGAADIAQLDSEAELALMRKIFEFPDIVARAAAALAPNGVATYLHKLAVAANKFYETTPILKDGDADRRGARLALTEVAARTLAAGLNLLGIKAPEKI
ncbi:MAG: arginine--tRNA ligase [Candidatus Pacebacteria bacterium]|nr:arginine--tRNA ligase [Candidatus Paceibacterota bacterium]